MALEQQLDYWRRLFADGLPPLGLPSDRPRPAAHVLRHAQATFAFGQPLSAALHTMSRQEATSLFLVLLAAFKTVLYRYTSQTDLVVGAGSVEHSGPPTAAQNADRAGILPLRTELSGTLTFRELLQRVCQSRQDAQAHADLPLERLLQACRQEGSAVLDVLLLQASATDGNGGQNPRDLAEIVASAALMLEIHEAADGLHGTWSYADTMFEPATIARISGHLLVALESIVVQPEQRLIDVPLLTEAERRQIIVEWNARQHDYPQDACLHTLVEAQAAKLPDHVALFCDGAQMTYRELNERANQLAHHLRGLGVGPNVRVGLCCERSLDLIVGVLATLKAGGAYVPLDPAYPVERLQFMLQDSEALVLLTQQPLLAQVAGTARHTFCLDSDWPLVADQPRDNPPLNITPDHLAYIIYTSGSTGRPKGVCVQHRGLISYLVDLEEYSPLRFGNRCALWTSISFDVSVYEIFSTLGFGATLYIVTEPVRSSGPDFIAWLDQHQLTHSYVPPFMIPDLAAYAATDRSTLALRRIEVGVEVLSARMLASIARNVPGIFILNGYGPTEATICTTIYVIGPNDDHEGNAPIGYPIGNTQVYILDPQLQPVPVGVPGEIYIGGVGVAQGYLNRPDLTAEKFLPDPFSGYPQGMPGVRLYRTGDLARYLADGAIDFLGRIDNQVKIRGFRVELGEIEAALRQHPAIREAVVVVGETTIGGRQHKRLVAYVVENKEQPNKEQRTTEQPNKEQRTGCPLGAQVEGLIPALDSAGLRSFLIERLPDYMIPSAFVVLPALPLLPNGKLDRKALPMPELPSADDQRYIAPRTPTEESLARIWMAVLELERVGVYDHFFELGGNSLLATQILAQVSRVFGMDIPQRSLFEAPTIAALAEQIDRQPGAAANTPIQRVDRSGPLPQSFAQQRLWFIDQWAPGSAVYNTAAVLELHGPLAADALHHSINQIVARHEALRTTFSQGTTAYGTEAIQVIAPAFHVPLPVIDLAALPEPERLAEAQRHTALEAQRPFDLQQGPLIRVTLLRLDATTHWLLLAIHHIVFDGWSHVVLLRELSTLYAASIDGRTADLPELPIQYADYSVWQRDWLQGSVLEQQLAYWRQQLDQPPVLDLPSDHPRPPAQSFKGRRIDFTLSPALREAIHALSRRQGTTLFMVLLAAFKTLLYRYTGQPDIVVGSPIAGRTRAEIEPLIGFFVNTLALRTDLGGNPSFRELLRRVRETTLGAYTHQDVPFERLVEELQVPRDVSRNPLFDVMFVLDPAAKLELPGLDVSVWEPHSQTAKFDLTLSMQDTGADIFGMLEYNTTLFEAATVERLIGHLELLLSAVTADPDQRLNRLPLLTEAEHQQLFVEWNQTGVDYCRDWCAHQIFEAQAARTPDAVAVVFEDQQMTYRELNSRANRLANYLHTIGVAPDVLVGLCVDRSLELVVGFLGLLKAGGAYIPLDATYPTDRLKFILDDANAPVILTQHKLLAKLPPTDATLVCLDTDWPTIAQSSSKQPDSGVTPENLTYVMYTSGTTGRPKGIAMPHRPLVNMITWQCRYMPGWSGVRTLQFASLNFDVSYQEMFTTWLEGGTVVAVAEDVRRDARALLHYLIDQRVERLFLPFALLQHLAEVGEEADLIPPMLREIVAAGEQLQITRPIANWIAKLDQCVLYNEYGPSECHVVTGLTLTGPPDEWPKLAPVGRAIANTEIYLLDAHWQPVPQGVPGEVYIGGVSLARGYLQRPDLTAEKFIPDWLSGRPGDRLYRTGDLARYQADGNLFFLGRTDHQVKVRGFRIELGEIESVLRQHPAIRETSVIVREDLSPAGGQADKRIVAYVVPKQADAPSDGELRAHIKQQLPDYMVPSAFVVLPALPLTPHGKLDRRALPAPAALRPQIDNDFVPPRTPLEEVLCGIWTQVLGVEQIGVFDSFFDLGGHSLIATQIVSRVRQVCNVDLPLRALFEEPTVARLAEHVTAALQRASIAEVPPIQPVDRSGPLPLSLAQQRFWFLDQWEPGNPTYHISTALRLTGPLNVAALHQSINTIVARHEVLRTSFTLANGQPVQQSIPALTIELPLFDLTALPASERTSAAQQHALDAARQSFDLAQGPLIRTRLARLHPEGTRQDHLLILVIHHIVSDGWSQGVFMRELATLYDALAHEQPVSVPDLPVQYADYSVWQRQSLQGDLLEQQLTYWRNQLAGRPDVLDLPSDHPRPAVQTFNGALYSFTVPGALAAGVRSLSRHEGATFFMVLLATFKTLLYRYTGQPDIVVGSPIAGRTRAEIEPLIGCFINTLVLRTDLGGNPSFRELLRRVRETTLAAYAHQELPFEKLVEELQIKRDVSRNPLFQTMFVVQSTTMEPITTSDLQMEPAPIENGTTNLDLTLAMQDTPQGMTGDIEYNTDLFEPETITRLAGHFLTLLEQIITNPDHGVADLSLLTTAEQQMLHGWNATAVPLPDELCVHTLFEAQVARTPDAVALIYEDQQLSYSKLNARANQLAHYLRAVGVGPDTRVALCIERSPDLAVGVLGILKAGGAYVPLDPSYPQERLHWMLADTQAPVLLTQTALTAQLPSGNAHLICLDRDWPTISAATADNPAGGVLPDHLAYVIYTSGSTGKPKGVAVSHRAIGNRLLWSQTVDPLSADDRVLQVASMSFDIAFWELVGPLLHGAAVVLARPDANQDSGYLVDLLARERITVAHLVPSVIDVLLTEPKLAECRALRSIYYGGEASASDLPGRIRAQLPVELLHFYGPTEAAINATAWRYDAARQPIPIGRPISNMQSYLLDQQLQPVPVGVPGKLYLGGVGLARGYHNRPDLTAEKFIPDPFSNIGHPQGGARLYDTGDLARYRPDGNLLFLGRADQQVKIRGVRIELGEIESVLRQQSGVRDAVVLARQDTPGAARLVAYIVENKEQTNIEQPSNLASPDSCSVFSVLCSPQELRAFLKTQLPDYMVPSAFVFLDALPLTPTGKIDRRALPVPDQSRPEQTFVAPRTPVEQVLANIWSTILKIERVSVEDNFFELGGHSLLATQVVSRMRQIFQMNVPQRSIFEAQTIADLAAYLSANEPKPGQVAKIAQLVQRVKGMSADNKREMLRQKKTT
jgi:amino acid adenylation domain-containing protein